MQPLCRVIAPLRSYHGCLYHSARARLASLVHSRNCKQWLTTSSCQESQKPWYCTTPIFYVNAAPHVGHLYTLVLADIFKRWHALKGGRALLCTGTDEHGMKVQRAADQAKTDPKAFCDAGAEVFQSLADAANISHDDFIRTTEERHKDAVQYAWTVLKEKDLIYLSKHEGWYCVSDETYYPQSGVHLTVDASTGRKMMASVETGKEVEWSSEVNYRFRLSAFREPLLKLYRERPDFIRPKGRMRDVVKSVTEDLQDLSISRPSSRLTWGIPVPGDDSQTIYVWLDALLNYATSAGFPWAPGSESEGGWPADLHIIGKDIVRFHCIYWPAFLMGLSLPLPKQILTHAHWTLGKAKMAKSTGNVVNPFFALERFGVDVMRYYLAHDGGISQDADYTNEFIAARFKKGLQGGLGNLLTRVTRGKGLWSIRRAVERARNEPVDQAQYERHAEHLELLKILPGTVESNFAALDCGKALRAIMDAVYDANAFFQGQEPWRLARRGAGDPDAERCVDATIYLTAETLRISGIFLQPFMPEKAGELLDKLGIAVERRTIGFGIFGADLEYGHDDTQRGLQHVLFPPLLVED